jgi:hypothetical protein
MLLTVEVLGNSTRAPVGDGADEWELDLDQVPTRTWSGWRGAYRVVTDGTDLVLEAEEPVGAEHGGGAPRADR